MASRLASLAFAVGVLVAGCDTGSRRETSDTGVEALRPKAAQVPEIGNYIVFDTPMHFARGDMKSRVTFDTEGRIAGLFILRPDVP